LNIFDMFISAPFPTDTSETREEDEEQQLQV
jgi:hypothetical protein